jgi:hypothetical protein
MTTETPRHYWRGLTDETLEASRAEYLAVVAAGLVEDAATADELTELAVMIADDLARRAAERERIGR